MWQRLARWRQRQARSSRPPGKGASLARVRPHLEALEDRLVPSWGPIPPASITLPPNAAAVTLDGNGDAQGTASITNDEVDFYTFIAATSGFYHFQATTPSDFMDTVLGVYSGLGQRVGYDADSTLADHDSAVSGFVSAGDPVYFGVTNLYGFSDGKYSWSVDGPAEGSDRFTELMGPRPFNVAELKSALEPIKSSLTVETPILFPEQLNPDERFVYQLHLDLLRHAPSLQTVTALAGRISQGTSRFDIAYEIVSDRAYHRLVVEDLYTTFLHRAMTSTDYAILATSSAYVEPSATLPSPDLATREGVAASLVAGPEYYQGRGGGTDDGWLDALYQDALGRAPTQAERDAFHQAGTDQAARQATALALFQGQEFRERLVDGFYQQFLRRPAEPGGLAFWVGQLQNGQTAEAVIAGIVETQEYFDYSNR